MASATFSLEDAKRNLDEDGFVHLDDSSIGEHVSDMEQKGFPWVSKDGLDFWRDRVLEDDRIRAVVESVLGECTLVHFLRYQARPDRAESFWVGGPTTTRRALLVHLHPKGAQVEYYRGSHLHDLPMRKGARLLWETEPSALSEVGCVAPTKHFPNGGITILDARLRYTVAKEYTITVEFVTNNALSERWPKMEVPAELEPELAKMQTGKIRVNYKCV